MKPLPPKAQANNKINARSFRFSADTPGALFYPYKKLGPLLRPAGRLNEPSFPFHIYIIINVPPVVNRSPNKISYFTFHLHKNIGPKSRFLKKPPANCSQAVRIT